MRLDKRLDNETDKYARMGIAALIPGMVHAIEIMQAELAEMRKALDESEPAAPKQRKSVLRDHQPVISAGKSGWSDDPEERSREMKRRRTKAKRNAKKTAKAPTAKLTQPNHPRNPDHPDHGKWVAKLRRLQKKRWDSLTDAQRQERLDKLQAGRKAA